MKSIDGDTYRYKFGFSALIFGAKSCIGIFILAPARPQEKLYNYIPYSNNNGHAFAMLREN